MGECCLRSEDSKIHAAPGYCLCCRNLQRSRYYPPSRQDTVAMYLFSSNSGHRMDIALEEEGSGRNMKGTGTADVIKIDRTTGFRITAS